MEKRRPALPVITATSPGSGSVDAAASGASIRFVTLGCDKNTVDSERMLAGLAAAGGDTTGGDEADVIVINTCGFIDAAREESVDTILEALRLKESGRVRAVRLSVAWCSGTAKSSRRNCPRSICFSA